jgi:phage terminase large subunit-like protein
MATERPYPAAEAREIRLILVRGVKGKGVEADPVRAVYSLVKHTGELVACFDPYADPEGFVSACIQGLMRDE